MAVELGIAEGIHHEDFHKNGLRRSEYTMPHSRAGVYGVGKTDDASYTLLSAGRDYRIRVYHGISSGFFRLTLMHSCTTIEQ